MVYVDWSDHYISSGVSNTCKIDRIYFRQSCLQIDRVMIQLILLINKLFEIWRIENE